MITQKLKQNIEQVTHIQICNQAQDDMIDKFGIFATYCLFWIPKYDKWYENRIKELKSDVLCVESEQNG